MFVPSKGGPAVNDGAYVLNSQGFGAARDMRQLDWEPGYLRPFIDERSGQPAVIVNSGRWTTVKGERKPVKEKRFVRDVINKDGIFHPVLMAANTQALPKEAWIALDKEIMKAARQPLRAYADLAAANSYGGFDAMQHLTLETQAMSDPGEAVVDMDGITEGRNDSPLFDLRSLPLPMTHSDFFFSARRLASSRASSMPFDTTMGEAAGRRISETVEDTTIGTTTGITFGTQTAGPGTHTGTSTVYGYTNFPSRLTKTNFTKPTAGGWVPDTTYNEILAAIGQLKDGRFHGPFVLYFSAALFQYMSRVYSVSGGNTPGETLISMLKKNEALSDVRELYMLNPAAPDNFVFILVQMTSNVARAINGQGITTVQWETKGGMQVNYKVYAIWVPQLRADYNARTGILHGTFTP